MKRILCMAAIAALISCKTPHSGSELRSTGAFDTYTGKACLVWIKGEDVYYKHCEMQNQCEPTDGRVVMGEKAYVEKLRAQYGVSTSRKSEVDNYLAKLEAKYNNFLSIQTQLAPLKESNPDLYEQESRKAQDRIFGTSLALSEVQNYKQVIGQRETQVEKILASVRDLRTKQMSIIQIPEIAAALEPVFGKDISNCFDADKAPQVVESVAVQRAAEAEWNAYQAWRSADTSVGSCVPVEQQSSSAMNDLLRGWYDLKIGSNRVSYSSRANCEAARSNARAGVFCAWGYEGINYHRVTDGAVVGTNPRTELVIQENGRGIYPKARSLEQCFDDLRQSAQIVARTPGFIAVPKYNNKAERIGNSYQIVALWNGRVVLENVSVPSPSTPPTNVSTTALNTTPQQPNTGAIFSGNQGSQGNSQATNTNTNSNSSNNSNNSNNGSASNGNSATVQRLVAGLKAAKAEFNYVPDTTRDACLSATRSSSEPWSDLMAHYYCLFPIQDNAGAYSIRACFTGSLRGQNPYPKVQGRKAAFDACINRSEFAWIKADNERKDIYEMIMVGGPNNVSQTDQNAVITSFYGSNPVPVR